MPMRSRTRLIIVFAAVLASGLLTVPNPAPGTAAASYTNPVVWQDFADIDIIRVGDVYYASASTMHYSPGAPILRSYDLVNWEFAGHSLPSLDFGSKYNLSGGRAYVDGVWASTLNYRQSNGTFYWAGLHRLQRHLRLHRDAASRARGPGTPRSTTATTTLAC